MDIALVVNFIPLLCLLYHVHTLLRAPLGRTLLCTLNGKLEKHEITHVILMLLGGSWDAPWLGPENIIRLH